MAAAGECCKHQLRLQLLFPGGHPASMALREGTMRSKTCFTRFNVRILAVAMGAALASPVSATNGYFSNGYGTQSKAMGGTGVALSLDSLAPASNPAALMNGI